LTIADFHKVAAYTHLYCTTTGTAIGDISATFVTAKRPVKVFGYMKESCGYRVEESAPGIYAIGGGIVPIQVIVNRELREEENLWLRNLGKGVSAVSMRKVLNKSPEVSSQIPIGAYIEVLLEANADRLEEAFEMGNGNMTVEEVLEKTGWAARFEARGEALGEVRGERNGKLEVAKNLMSLRTASRAVSLASHGPNGGSFDRKFIIPSGLIPNFCKRYLNLSRGKPRGIKPDSRIKNGFALEQVVKFSGLDSAILEELYQRQ
jgi:hypothetical protein